MMPLVSPTGVLFIDNSDFETTRWGIRRHLGWEGNTKLEGKLSGLENLSSTTNSKHMGEGASLLKHVYMNVQKPLQHGKYTLEVVTKTTKLKS